MRSLRRQNELPIPAVEISAEVLQFSYAIRPFLHEHADCLLVAQACSRLQRVLQMELGRIERPQRRGDAALGEKGGRVVQRALRDEGHVP